MLYAIDAKGAPLWQASVGDEVTGAVAADLNADGHDAIVASSMSFNVVAFDVEGKCLWRKNLGDAVLSLTAADLNGDERPEIVAGCEDGRIVVLNGRGEIVGEYQAPGAVSGVAIGRMGVVARTRTGEVIAVRF